MSFLPSLSANPSHVLKSQHRRTLVLEQQKQQIQHQYTNMSTSPASTPRASPEPPKKKSSSKKRKIEQPEIEVDIDLPEPPSKKAKRALKKGKVPPPKPDSDDDAGTASTKPPKKERSPYGVWIGNLRFTVTRDELRRWLVDNSGGSITDESITRVHVPSSKPKGGKKQADGEAAAAGFENKGFAYVDFATYEATVAAIALSETEWYRRKLLIKDATSFEGRPEEHARKKGGAAVDGGDEKKSKPSDEVDPASQSRKIFVGNMSFQTTEDDVRELFSKCGEIEWVKVATFEDSGKCKGYGWVKFKEAEAAGWAVKGFIKIKEVEETEEDFMDVDTKEDEEEDSGSDDSGAEEEKPQKKKTKPAAEKKVKTRKWWVNTLHGRRLKIEHAEDDQTRYKKRFSGKKDTSDATRGGQPQHNRPQGRRGDFKPRRDDAAGTEHQRKEPAEVKAFETDINVARLTGAAVKSEGRKITFD